MEVLKDKTAPASQETKIFRFIKIMFELRNENLKYMMNRTEIAFYYYTEKMSEMVELFPKIGLVVEKERLQGLISRFRLARNESVHLSSSVRKLSKEMKKKSKEFNREEREKYSELWEVCRKHDGGPNSIALKISDFTKFALDTLHKLDLTYYDKEKISYNLDSIEDVLGKFSKITKEDEGICEKIKHDLKKIEKVWINQ